MPACDDLFASLCRIISERTGLRVNRWAKSRLEKILPKRLAIGGYRRASEYYHFLRDDPSSSLELTHLISEITTCRPRLVHADVSSLVSSCAAQASAASHIPNILTAGATAAEDAYSAAITIACDSSCQQQSFNSSSGSQRENTGRGKFTRRNEAPCIAEGSSVAITAADFDLERLSAGTQGIFTSRAVTAMSDEVRRAWLNELKPRRFQAKPHLRESIRWLFVPLHDGCSRNLSSIRWDLIICRRMFGHMSSHTLGRWKRLASLLAPGGMLACDRRLNLPSEVQAEPFGRLWLHKRSVADAPDPAQRVTMRSRRKPSPGRKSVPGDVTARRRSDNFGEPFYAARRIAATINLLRDRQVDEARSQALAALAVEPHSPEVLLACGTVFERMGNLAAAGRYYRKALMVRPTMAAAYLQLAELHKNAAQSLEAEKLYRSMPDMPKRLPGVAFPA